MRMLTEMIIQLEGVCRPVNVPVIADAEAGFGSVLNVVVWYRSMNGWM